MPRSWGVWSEPPGEGWLQVPGVDLTRGSFSLVHVRCCLHQVEVLTMSLVPVLPSVPHRKAEDGADLGVSAV